LIVHRFLSPTFGVLLTVLTLSIVSPLGLPNFFRDSLFTLAILSDPTAFRAPGFSSAPSIYRPSFFRFSGDSSVLAATPVHKTASCIDPPPAPCEPPDSLSHLSTQLSSRPLSPPISICYDDFRPKTTTNSLSPF